MVTASSTSTSSSDPQPLWQHPNPEQTEYVKFLRHIESKYAVSLTTPTSLWEWSVAHIPDFWAEVWDFTGIVHSKRFDTVVDDTAPMFPRPEFFKGARLNFAENLLFPRGVQEEGVAVWTVTEEGRRSYTWKELREEVRRCQAAMEGRVKMGDRVVGRSSSELMVRYGMGAGWDGMEWPRV